MNFKKYYFLVVMFFVSTQIVFTQDNGNQFSVAWQDDGQDVTAGWTISRHSFDFDNDGFGEFCAYDMVSGQKLGFIFEANDDDSYQLMDAIPMGGGAVAITDWNQNGLNELTILDEAMLIFESTGSDNEIPFDPNVIWEGLPKKGVFGGTSQGAPAVFDADGDGELEIVCNYARNAYHIPMYNSFYLSIFSFNGDFDNPGGKIEFTNEFGIECCGFDWGDIDNDGRIDIVTAVNQTPQLRVFTSFEKDSFELKWEWKKPESVLLEMAETYTPMVVDINQDGQTEIIYCDTHGLVYVISGDLSQQISEDNFHYLGRFQPIGPGRNIADMRSTNPGGSLGDQDADGKPDLYWCAYHAEAVYDLEYESGSILDSTSYNWYRIWENTTDVPFGATMLCLGADMDQDKKREIVMIQRESNLDPPAIIVLESEHETSAVLADNLQSSEINYILNQNYPNPFNASTKIAYTLLENGYTELKIYNQLGQEVKSIVNGYQPAGNYVYNWHGLDFKGNVVPTGLYIYSFRFGDVIVKKKMIFLK